MKTKYDIINLMERYKSGENKEDCLLKIIENMKPVINKYTKKCRYEEHADMQQELSLAVIEAANKIEVYENEGQVILFLANSVKFKFLELYRKEKILKELESSETEEFNNISNTDFESYEDIEFRTDLEKMVTYKSNIQQQIAYYILCEDMSDAEIATHLHISRQYVNRSKKTIFKTLNAYSSNN